LPVSLLLLALLSGCGGSKKDPQEALDSDPVSDIPMEFSDSFRLASSLDKELVEQETNFSISKSYTYTEQGRIQSQSRADDTSPEEEPLITSFEYAGNQLVSVTVGELTQSYVYEDDRLASINSIEDDKQDSQEFFFEEDKLIKVTGKRAFDFFIRECFDVLDDPPEQPEFELSYDPDGKLIEVVGNQDSYTKKFAYLESGLLEKITTRYDCATEPSIIEYRYTETGLLNRIETSSPGFSSRTDREYDEDGRLVTEIVEQTFNNDETFEKTASYRYNDNNLLVTILTLDGPNTRTEQFGYEPGSCLSEPSPNPVKKLLHSINGQVRSHIPESQCGYQGGF